nr:GNAT family N-acetyltransferase [Ardenticatena sp.]
MSQSTIYAHDLVVRPARHDDTDAIMQWLPRVLGEQDYVLETWHAWLDDDEPLLVGVFEGVPIAITHMVHIAPDELWLQGLRLHPDYHGRGLGKAMHEANLRYALSHPSIRVASLATANDIVRHLCAESGMRWCGDWLLYEAETLSEAPTPTPTHLSVDDLAAIEALLTASPHRRTHANRFAAGWTFPRLRDPLLREWLAEGRLMGWREADGRIRALVVAIPPPDVEDGDAWTLLAAGDADGLAWAGHVVRERAACEDVQRLVAFIPDNETWCAAWEDAGWHFKSNSPYKRLSVYEKWRTN